MEPADPDRPARPAPTATGTLGTQATGAGQAPDGGGLPGAGEGGGQPGTPRSHVPALPGRVRSWQRRAARWPAWRGWLRVVRHPVARHLLLLAGFIGAGIAVTWPRATYLTGPGRLPSSRDSASYVWGFWWVAHQLTHLGNPWFTGHMAAPVGVDLGFHTLMPLPGVLLAPVTLALGPAASYNLLVTILPGLLCYAAYRAARLWLRSATGAVAAGAFFGLSSMLTQQAWYHVNIAAGALFLPMALEASVRLRRAPGRRQALILGLVMGVAVLTDQESAVLAAIVTGLTLLPWLVRHPAWAKVWPAALAVVTGTVIASPQIIAMIIETRVRGLTIDPHTLAVSYKQYGIGLPGMFTPTPRVTAFGLNSLAGPFLHGRDNEGMPMFGSVLTVTALAGLLAARRRRGAWLLAALWLGCVVLALGTSLWIGKHQYLPLATWWQQVRVSRLMPYTWFVRIPGLSSFREADRLAILGLLPAALLAGAAVDWLRYHARPMIVVVLALGVLEAGYSGSEAGYTGNPRVGTMAVSYAGVDRQIAADRSGSVVLDIPFGLRGGIPVWGVPFFPKALVMATEDGHPRSIAYISRVPRNTIDAVAAHHFYSYLVTVQHQRPRVCPWALPAHGGYYNLGCQHPPGVVPLAYLKLTPAQLTAARRDATRMHIGWVVVWKRNISVDGIILPYLRRTGFCFAYRSGNVLVYKHATSCPAT
jgi:hypothetical protein